MKTIDCTPTWSAILGIYIAVLQNPDASAEAIKAAHSELSRMAKLADAYVASQKK